MAAAAEQIQLPEALDLRQRTQNDTETWCAEMLHGSMRTPFNFYYDGNELYAEDGGELGEVFSTALKEAHQIVRANPNLLFELRRRLIDQGEYQDMLDMASGELPNTMVVVSDYPPELMDWQEDVGGYNASRRQTMLRVIARQPDGSIQMITQSLDGSNRQALESIYQALGRQPEAGELLGQRLKLDLPESWQANLTDSLTATYDSSLAAQYGGQWHAGLRQESARQIEDTYHFACQQQDLIQWFTEAKLADPVSAEKLRFKMAATMTERYENRANLESHNKEPGRQSTSLQPASSRLGFIASQPIRPIDFAIQAKFYDEIDKATTTARQAGRVFSGCGASARSLLDNSDPANLSEAGYGNKTDQKESYGFTKKMHCVVCQAPPKKGEGKKSCGPCGICRGCDSKLSSKS